MLAIITGLGNELSICQLSKSTVALALLTLVTVASMVCAPGAIVDILATCPTLGTE